MTVRAHISRILSFATLLAFFALPAAAQTFPKGLAPGMYYYFQEGDDKPSFHYVPGASKNEGDPFAQPVQPLPIPGQENFPALPFGTLQDSTWSDFQPYLRERAQNRAPVAAPGRPNAGAGMRPADQLSPASAFQQSGVSVPATRPRTAVKGLALEQMRQTVELAQKAVKLLQQNQYSAAVPLLQKAAAGDPNPNSGAVHADLGYAYSRLGKPESALMEYQKALQFNPRLNTCIGGIAKSYQDMGKVAESKLWYQKYLLVSPNAPEADKIRKYLTESEQSIKQALEQAAEKPGDSWLAP